jgi:regulator of sigma E protease
MDIVLMIIYCAIILGFLVLIHEGGHYLAARMFGVRVSEFMIGLPGPNIGFTRKGTKFGVTAVPLGGYARICGMEPGEESPHLADMIRCVFEHGTLNMEDASRELGITDDEAYAALDELAEWGTIEGPRKTDKYNTYRTYAVEGDASHPSFEAGEPHPLDDSQAFYESERRQQYRSLPFWKRSIILLAGPGMNILFTILAFVVIYSFIGVDMQNQNTGELTHIQVDPLKSLMAGFNYVGMVVVAIAGLFNPQTAADTVSNSTSIVGIAVLSKSAADQGAVSFTMFAAMLSVSLGLMNMLPIPPLDGGRFVVEVYQRIRRKAVGHKAMTSLSIAGIALFTLFFFFMLNQDVQRFVFGNWG